MARRLATGRALPVLQELRRISLFDVDGGSELPSLRHLQPGAGLTAKFDNRIIFIVDTFRCRGVWKADVVPIVPSSAQRLPGGADWVLSRRAKTTCDFSDLSDVGLRFRVIGFEGDSVYLRAHKSRSIGKQPGRDASQ